MKDTANVLSCPMQPNDAKAATVRDYLVALLERLWVEEEGFSGKRPFGNSGWAYEVYEALVKADIIEGEVDEDGYLETVDHRHADELIVAAIRTLGSPENGSPADHREDA